MHVCHCVVFFMFFLFFFSSFFFLLMIRRPPRSTLDRSSAASDVYKRQEQGSRLGANFGAQAFLLSSPRIFDVKNSTRFAAVKDERTFHNSDSFCPKVMKLRACLLYTSPSPRDRTRSRMPSSA